SSSRATWRPVRAELSIVAQPSAWQPRLQGELLGLRPVTPEDWEPLFALGSDPLVWALHPASDRWREAVFRAYFEDGLASGGALVAVEAGSGAVIGWS